ncbi:MAG: 5,6-dimethylbenzimidazole synthase [Methylocella sp.]
MLARFDDTPCGPAEAAVKRGEQGDPPIFDSAFRDRLAKLFAWRRDVRRFKPDPVPPPLIEELVRTAALAPSVGNSQPWRFVSVETLSAREAVVANFNACNAAALASYEGERAALYASLKLSGLREAPVHLAVFCDHATEAGFGLGRKTMPETLDYSVVAAIHTFWLSARTKNLGVGWVSILDPLELCRALDVPAEWKLIAYLCVGFPLEDHLDSELVRYDWQAHLVENERLHRR